MIPQELQDTVIRGDAGTVGGLVADALAQGVSPQTIISSSLIPAMTEVGARFERGDIWLPEMLAAARAMQTGLDVLRPLLVDHELETVGRAVIGTVKGDLHDIGKNLVRMMFEGAGFEVVDLGVDVAPETFVEAVEQRRPDVVGMSALLTTTLPAIEATIEALVHAGVRDDTKVMVGGAPLTQAYADQVDADGYAPDAASAMRKAKELLGLG